MAKRVVVDERANFAVDRLRRDGVGSGALFPNGMLSNVESKSRGCDEMSPLGVLEIYNWISCAEIGAKRISMRHSPLYALLVVSILPLGVRCPQAREGACCTAAVCLISKVSHSRVKNQVLRAKPYASRLITKPCWLCVVGNQALSSSHSDV